MEWDKLSMPERAEYIKLGVMSGITDIDSIRKIYNEYAEGGVVVVRDRGTGKEITFNSRQEADDYISSNYKDPNFYQGELPELTVTPRTNRTLLQQGAANFEETFGISPRDAASFIPYVGDALDIKDIVKDVVDENYLEAGIGAGMLLLPNIIEKPLKKAYKFFKGLSTGTIRRFKNIPIENNKYYRQVSKPAIVDANTTGVIRANPESYQFGEKKEWAGASFYNGRLQNPSNKPDAIIVGDSNIEWVPKVQGGHVEVKDFDLQLSRLNAENPNIYDDMTPIFVDQVNMAPTDKFYYWERGNGLIGRHFYTKRKFNTNPTNPHQDLEYLKAIDRNDTELAQILRDEHFKNSTYIHPYLIDADGNPIILYHNSPNEGITSFDLSRAGTTDHGTLGYGIYTTPYQDYAALYGPNQYRLYGNIKNPRDLRGKDALEIGLTRNIFGEQAFTGIGIDGIIADPLIGHPRDLPMEVVGFKPSQFKFSDAITRDDKGLIIPLSKRDNFTIDDMRFNLGGYIKK